MSSAVLMDIPSNIEPRVASFPVTYQERFGLSNAHIRGKGEFAVRVAEPRFQFTGKTKSTFGAPTTLQFSSDQIWNAVRLGRQVRFQTGAGVNGRPRPPFVFFCATSDAAADVLRHLPTTIDADFIASQSFGEKLRALPAATSPWGSVTNIIIGINLLAFVAMGFAGAGWIETADMTPYFQFVANNGGATTDGEWWRIVTAMFVHYGILHLALNMWALFQAGHFVEKLLGRSLFTAAYVGSGIAASFTSIYWHGDKVWSAGASGAVFGVYGMLLGFMLREKQSVPKPVLQPMMKSTLTFAGYNLVYGMIIPRIDNAAHIGGLVGGCVLGWLVALPVDREIRAQRSFAKLGIALGFLTVASLAAGWFAPRFDYHFREELAWADLNRDPIAREPEVERQLQTRLAGASNAATQTELALWVQRETIPFYRDWRDRLRTMNLAPDRRTEKNRTRLVAFINAKLANLQQLQAALAENDSEAVQRFTTAERQAIAEVRSHAD